ncbi:zinc-dependent alcohol dehydrogenase [Paracidobacterium acidisoli]|uniref:Zn-dependent alcohol dehydrogenase n=1 Tax=Paracidobacterium acidisoli TaxID=2303751 RepID=A0A372IM01_9BACT|nr:zinc-binding dehydrogenase [Paracidobacterium acidisoli]MBT9332384.1 alcohol dehydrogenase catalytic domain-containing protein [Paracidobacterium acidisoli]
MKALVKYASGDGNVDIRDVDEPKCSDSQVKLEIAYCGLCGTDIHVLHDTFRNYPPVILGHEFSGTVVEVGRNVNGAVTPGERVAGLGATAVTCGECHYCRSGYFIFCSNRRGMGHGVNGAFARYVVMRPDQLYRIPDNFTLEEAAMSEPFAAAVQAVTEISDVRIGDTALISGPGPIGLLCLKLLAAEGVKTIVAGAAGDGERLDAALRFGAAAVVNVGEQKLSDAVQELTKGEGIDVAFECAGHPDSVRGCLESLRPMGRYMQVAICGQDIQFPIDQIFYKQLKLNGSVCYTARTWERMMKIYAEGRIRLNDLISDKLPISEWRKAFELCRDRKALKVLMYPEG